ncbi:MAG TPA: hypothetical protein PK771_14490, partial [Spirochaetota bacterium]|nr:hypothetical protein [Spirochaetota bacterium]
NEKDQILKLYNSDKNYFIKKKKISKNDILFLNDIFKKLDFTLKNSIPDGEDINNIMKYAQKNSLLLFPYEWGDNPFSKESVENGIKKKEEYLVSTPFFSPDEDFFLDPLMKGFDVLKLANSGTSGKYFPEYGGIVSNDKKSYIKVLKAHFLSEDYENSKKLYELDKKINNYGKSKNMTSFLYSAHLYYWDSYKTIQFEVTYIFILSITLTLLIFFLFFRKISILFYGFLPIIGGFALTFLFIAIFKKEYGGIAFAFGSTTAGISIDYTIHYLSKICLYPNLKNLRDRLSFSMFLGFLTTIAAFVLLSFSNIVSLQEMALFGILGITFSFLLNYFVLQKIIPPEEYQCQLYQVKIPEFGKIGFIVWIVILFIMVSGLFFSRFEDNIMNLDKRHPDMDKRIKLIQSSFSESTDSVFLVFTGSDRDVILKKSLLALQYLNKNSLSILTPAIFLPPKDILNERKSFVKNNFKSDVFNNSIKESIFEENSFNNWIENIKNIDSLNLSELPKYIEDEIDSMFVNWNEN